MNGLAQTEWYSWVTIKLNQGKNISFDKYPSALLVVFRLI